MENTATELNKLADYVTTNLTIDEVCFRIHDIVALVDTVVQHVWSVYAERSLVRQVRISWRILRIRRNRRFLWIRRLRGDAGEAGGHRQLIQAEWRPDLRQPRSPA